MSLTHITVRGAREHNLKGFDIALPREQLIVITGLSGSGKSSLAFDTIYAEGQQIDDADSGKLDQRLANRRRTDAKFIGQLLHDEPLARVIAAGENAVQNRLHNGLPAQAVRTVDHGRWGSASGGGSEAGIR